MASMWSIAWTLTWLAWYISNLASFPMFCGYLIMIALSGLWQKYTSPLSLRPILVIYNFACCVASIITCGGLAYSVYLRGDIYERVPIPHLKPFFLLYWATKQFELLDTVFMILRHKNRQISFLHVYHHASMLLLSEIGYNSYTWASIATIFGINSFVHVVLYLYYGLSALYPNNPPKWKKQVTQLQIFQFMIGFVIAVYGYINGFYCIYSIFYNSTMFILFTNFYAQAYGSSSSKIKLK